jgi:hypothetical protein
MEFDMVNQKHKEKPLLPIMEYPDHNQGPHRMEESDPGSKNWVIKSFLPKPPVNNNYQNNSMNRSISFIADSKHYRVIDAECLRKNQKFIDKKFPPNFSSIWGFGET